MFVSRVIGLEDHVWYHCVELVWSGHGSLNR